jgi:hypothetical protein
LGERGRGLRQPRGVRLLEGGVTRLIRLQGRLVRGVARPLRTRPRPSGPARFTFGLPHKINGELAALLGELGDDFFRHRNR